MLLTRTWQNQVLQGALGPDWRKEQYTLDVDVRRCSDQRILHLVDQAPFDLGETDYQYPQSENKAALVFDRQQHQPASTRVCSDNPHITIEPVLYCKWDAKPDAGSAGSLRWFLELNMSEEYDYNYHVSTQIDQNAVLQTLANLRWV